MEKPFLLSARQLYYLGAVLKAQYIDFAYVTAVGSILENFSSYEAGIRDELIGEGYMTEDFSGNIEVSDELQIMLRPLFFSGVEATLEIVGVGEFEALQMYRYHIGDNKIIQVTNIDTQLELKEVGPEDVKAVVESILPDTYTNADAPKIEEYEPEKISLMICVKNAKLGEKSSAKVFVKMNQILYEESPDDVIRSVSRDEFIQQTEDILLEVM
ncbi:MAG: hypothetical protein K6E26_10575 [Clostridiales bacterium]|nr:hypothetical protein [Clostridiales bacterium]